MKILHTITSLDKGGAENHVATLGIIQNQNVDTVKFFISKNSKYWVKYLKKKKSRLLNQIFFLKIISFKNYLNYSKIHVSW